jgi:hypothetical protein
MTICSLSLSLSLAETVANVELAYYRQADQFVFSAQEVLAWYKELPVQEQATLQLLPPLQWLRLPAFIRPALVKRGYSLSGYMAAHLTQEEWAFWRESGNSLVAY